MRFAPFLWLLIMAAVAVIAWGVVTRASEHVGPVLDPDPQCVVFVDDGSGQALPVDCYP